MKAIITDLDRTLLRTDKSLSDYTLRILRACRERGIRLFAASARPLRDIRIHDERIGFDAITATNGAVLRLPEGIAEVDILRDQGEHILSRLLAVPDVTLSIETSGGLYANRDIPAWNPVVYDKFPALPEGVLLYKILASSAHPDLYENIPRALTPDVYHTIATGDLIQIMSKQATKWQGCLRMLSAFGIDPADAAYFGDDEDDVEPLRRCGMGVAVANAIPAALQAAAHTAASNDADGVAKFIEAHIL